MRRAVEAARILRRVGLRRACLTPRRFRGLHFVRGHFEHLLKPPISAHVGDAEQPATATADAAAILDDPRDPPAAGEQN